jgi:hypothetical protein
MTAAPDPRRQQFRNRISPTAIAVLCRLGTVHTFLAVSQSKIEPLSMTEVTAFFKP